MTPPDLTQGGLREGTTGGLLPVFLRFEPTSDPATLESYGQARLPVPADHRDLVIYRDAALSERLGCWRWHDRTRPKKGARVVTLNGFHWRPEWRPTLRERKSPI